MLIFLFPVSYINWFNKKMNKNKQSNFSKILKIYSMNLFHFLGFHFFVYYVFIYPYLKSIYLLLIFSWLSPFHFQSVTTSTARSNTGKMTSLYWDGPQFVENTDFRHLKPWLCGLHWWVSFMNSEYDIFSTMCHCPVTQYCVMLDSVTMKPNCIYSPSYVYSCIISFGSRARFIIR